VNRRCEAMSISGRFGPSTLELHWQVEQQYLIKEGKLNKRLGRRNGAILRIVGRCKSA
jgi:hypothetical protein